MADNVQAIEVTGDDCVIVFSKGGIEAYAPTVEGVQDMTDHMLLCMAIAQLCTTDKQWLTETLNRYDEYLSAMKGELN